MKEQAIRMKIRNTIFNIPIFCIMLTVVLFQCAKQSSGQSAKPNIGSTVTDQSQHSIVNNKQSKFIVALDSARLQLQSLKDSIIKYQSQLKSVSDDRIRDSLFIHFRSIYLSYQPYCDSFLTRDSVESYLFSNDSFVTIANAVFNKFGYSVQSTEGFWYIDAEFNYLFNTFNKFISQAMKDFLLYRSTEQEEGFSEDAGLLIPFDSVGSRAVKWEAFLTKYPSFILKSEVIDWYSTCVSTYLTGMDNSSVFSDGGSLDTSVKLSYEQFVTTYGDSKTGSLVKKWYDFLATKDFKQSSDIDSFLNANGTKSMWAVQPPTR
jgi:hypothetical protein